MTLTSRIYATLAGVLILAACGKAVAPVGIASLGAGFAAMFAAAPTSDPLDAGAVGIVPVSFTAEPFNP